MNWWWAILAIAAVVPITRAWWVNRRTALSHVMAWAIAAWLTWIAAAMTGTATARYLALTLTGCAGVAVLGARRPGVAAWHAVVAGLLAVLLLPLGQGFLAGNAIAVDSIRTFFLGAALAVGLLNFVPTRLGLGAAALLIACLLELRWLGEPMPTTERSASLLLSGIAPWLAWLGRWAWRTGWEGDRLWRDFRDRFGVVWGQRLREQFNSAARHAGLAVELYWRGLIRRDGEALSDTDRSASLDLLRALMMRFGLP